MITMMTLTEVNYYSKKMWPLVVILSLVLLIFIVAVRLLFMYSSSQSSTSEISTGELIKFDPIFDKIPAPKIESVANSSDFSLIMDTLDGSANVENATSAAKVYFIPQQNASFGFLSKIYSMATAVGIDTDITQHRLMDKTAIFDDGKRKLTIDIRTFNYIFEYKVSDNDDIGVAEILPSEAAIISDATTFLSSSGRYPTLLSQGDKGVSYIKFDPSTLEVTPLKTAENANAAEVNAYLPDLNGIPVVSSNYYSSQNYVLTLLGSNSRKIVRAQVQHFERSAEQVGLYPIRSSQSAWEALQSGEGVVVSSLNTSGEVKIRKVFLAYFDPPNYQEYFQPVYVFLGDDEFVGYVPAITPDFLLK